MSQFTNPHQLTSTNQEDFQPKRDDTARFLCRLWKKKLPEMMPIEPNKIPVSLRTSARWTLWQYWPYPNGAPGVLLKQANGIRDAWINQPGTWDSFDQVLNGYYRRETFDGPAYILSEDDPFVMIWLPNAIHGTILTPEAQRIVEQLDSYAEKNTA